MKKSNKQKEFEEKINLELYENWNPIGVSGLPKDEYFSYSIRIYQILSENCDAFFLCQYLMHISDNIIGIDMNWYKTLKIAEDLIAKFQKDIIENQNKQWYNKMYKKTGFMIAKVDFIKNKNYGEPYRKNRK